MDKKQLRMVALELAKKSSPVVRKTGGGRRAGKQAKETLDRVKSLKNRRVLEKLEKGEKMYISTLDVEMFKYFFNEQLGREVTLEATNAERIYQIHLV